MENKVDKIKVFISYCWGKHDDWIVSLANELEKKYQVVLDKWEIKHGHDLQHFMEESIRTADKVLIICDSKYREKADQRSAGVGKETSLITTSIFRSTKQEKFIPVFLEGFDERPFYLGSIMGIDIKNKDESISHYLPEFDKAIQGLPYIQRPEYDSKQVKFTSTPYHEPVVQNIIKVVNNSFNYSTNSDIVSKINQNSIDESVLDRVWSIYKEGQICDFIIKHQLKLFGNVLVVLDEENQTLFIRELYSSYASSTRLNNWTDYDVFGEIAKQVTLNTAYSCVKEISVSMWKDIGEVRWAIGDEVKKYLL